MTDYREDWQRIEFPPQPYSDDELAPASHPKIEVDTKVTQPCGTRVYAPVPYTDAELHPPPTRVGPDWSKT